MFCLCRNYLASNNYVRNLQFLDITIAVITWKNLKTDDLT